MVECKDVQVNKDYKDDELINYFKQSVYIMTTLMTKA